MTSLSAACGREGAARRHTKGGLRGGCLPSCRSVALSPHLGSLPPRPSGFGAGAWGSRALPWLTPTPPPRSEEEGAVGAGLLSFGRCCRRAWGGLAGGAAAKAEAGGASHVPDQAGAFADERLGDERVCEVSVGAAPPPPASALCQGGGRLSASILVSGAVDWSAPPRAHVPSPGLWEQRVATTGGPANPALLLPAVQECGIHSERGPPPQRFRGRGRQAGSLGMGGLGLLVETPWVA